MAKLWLKSSLCVVLVISTILVRYVYSTERNNLLPDCTVRTNHKSGEHIGLEAKKDEITRDLIIVSTLDGHVSALDQNNDGKLLWSHNTGEGSLLSSSISQLEMSSNGRPVRLIPSLDGNLYKFNGETLEPMPVTAETLLKSSFKLGDDVIVTGGIDSKSFGISLTNGQLRYSCAMNGCKTQGEDVGQEEDILVVRRLSQTVRAVTPRTGEERWNFSVGEHHLTFLEKLEADCKGGKGSSNPWKSASNNHPSNSKMNKSNQIQVIVPEGLIAVSTTDPDSKMLWSHKFDSPIVNTWHLKEGKLEVIDLFDQKQVVILPQKGDMQSSPLLYVGRHQQQVYIQQSLKMKNLLQKSANHFDSQNFPFIDWKPYAISSLSRTPYINHGKKQPARITHLNKLEEPNTAVVLKQSDFLEYPYDSGYYLYSGVSFPQSIENVTCPEEEDESYDNIIIVSIWHWWKEVLGISALTSLLVHFLFTRRAVKQMKRRMLAESSNSEIQIVPATPSLTSDDFKLFNQDENISAPPIHYHCEYVSRYTTDFEPIQRLGKGGFGVVFEARNKIDDCRYAIKRIPLPPRVEAQEKVMREVRALAKLDHSGIVRYFNAWQESPPPDWQEQHDKQLEEWSQIPCSPASTSNSVSNSKTTTKYSKISKRKSKGNPFKVGESFSTFNNGNISQNKEESDGDESGSFSFERDRGDCKSNNNDSFEIVFQNNSDRCLSSHFEDVLENDWKNEETDTSGVKFKRRKFDNNLIIDSLSKLEDSGCADRSQSTDEEDISIDVPKLTNLRKATRPDELNLTKKETNIKSSEDKEQLYLYIQMQLCRKETLKDWLTVHSERDHDEVLDIFDQIVSAVQYVHDCNLMHRDLKPSNIFFSVDGTVKVGDFGLVTALTESQVHTPSTRNSQNNNHLSQLGSSRHTDQVGTQLYMSPEQVASHSYSHKVDMFSLGLIFFEMLIPFPTQMERGKVMLKVKQHIFPEDFMTKYPNECTLVQKLLSHNPLERPSAAEIKQHHLFKAYQPQPEILSRYRRRRTLSQRISSSGSECDSQTIEDKSQMERRLI